jgi:hypothetical protein
MGEACVWHQHTGSWCGKLKERPYLQDLEEDGTIMSNRSSRKVMEDVDWTGFIWLGIWTSGGL